ncbi:MAG: hypothetical protein ANABAC_0375 [Anaerolineae bacterium]|nr:MAG: hypothetical protein ANABAC_0375 [Anaerolineae bacterium]
MHKMGKEIKEPEIHDGPYRTHNSKADKTFSLFTISQD